MAIESLREHPAPAVPTPRHAVVLEHVSKLYGRGEGAVAALDDVSVALPDASFTAVMGPSGSGKSTFLHMAAGLDTPTSGKVRLGGTDLTGMSEAHRTRLRRERVGFIFQAFNLMPSLSVAHNITLPLRFAGGRPDREWLREIVARTGLEQRMAHRPAQLSGGQQQRVAIARALLTRPDVVFADEPTGALDTRTGADILELLRDVVDVLGATVVMVTHDPVAAAHADRALFLADGATSGHDDAPTAERVAERMAHLGA